MTDIQETMAGNKNTPGNPNLPERKFWKPISAFALFAVAINLAGYFVFQGYKESIKQDKQDELGGIAELKVRQITAWMAERKGDAQALKDDPLFIAAVSDWLQQGGPAGANRTTLAARLSTMQQASAAYGYTSISLFDDKAMLRLSSSADEMPIQGRERARLLESMRTGQIVFSEIHREKIPSGERVEIELRAPLTQIKNGKARSIGAILFRIDPYRFLFPLIQRWPTHSLSAENLLVRRDGDEVVILNELRFRKDSALARLPLSQGQLLTVMAAMGREGLVEGVDYRGVPVVGVLGKVAGTSWSMVSKIDQAEIYAPINHLANWMLLLMLSLVGAGGGITIYWWQKEKKQHENELERQKLASHLDYLSKYANDIVILLDSTGKVAEFNDRALEALGYSAAELSNLKIDDLRAVDFSLSPAERFRQIDQADGGLIFESTMTRRNGTSFPVEISVRVVNLAGEKFYQGIIRDITERKQSENELIRQRKFIRQVVDSNPGLIFVKDTEGRFQLANEAMARSYGQTTAGIVGKCNSDIVHDTEQVAAYANAIREVLETGRERVAIETAILPGGEKHWFHTIRKPLKQDDGSVSVLTIAMDITELKQAEEEQRRLNRALRLLSSCNAVLAHAEDEAQLAEVCKLIVESGGYRMAWVGYAEHDPGKTVRPVMRYGFDEGYLDGAEISWADTERGCGSSGMAIRTGLAQVNQDFLSNSQMAPWREEALAHGYQSNISLPLMSESKAFGVLTIYSAEPSAFNAEEVSLLQELANNLAYGITTQRMRAERKLAMEKLQRSEEHFRFLTENATDTVFLMSLPDLHFSYVSPACTRLFGYTQEEFYNTPDLVRTILHPDSKSYMAEQTKNLLAGEASPCYEYQIIHKSGEIRWMNQRNAPIRDGVGSGELIAFQGIVTDITERKLAEAQFKREHIRLRTLVQTIPDLVWLKDTEGVFLGCNPRLERLYGAKEADIIGKTDYDFVGAELAEWFRLKDLEVMAVNKPCVTEEWITWPDNGQRTLLETIKTPMRDESGELIGIMGIGRDITEHKMAEEMEGRLRHILDSTLDMIYIFQRHSLRFVYMNSGALHSVGYSIEELQLMTPPDIQPLMPEAEFRKFIAPLVSGEKNLLRFETIQRHKDGTDLPVEGQLQLVREKNGESMFVAIVRDITERKRAERELQGHRTFMWQVIDTDPNRIFVKDINGNFLLVNQSTADAHGLSPKEMIGKNLTRINPVAEEVAEYLAADRKVIEEGIEISQVEPYTQHNGERRWLLTTKKRLTMPDGQLSVLGIAVDITQQKLSEMRLAESYRKLQRLSLHLENVRADERAKIALNLHDEMGATLVAIKMGVAWLASKLPADAPQLATEVTRISELVSGGIHTMHEIVTQLRPNLLGDVGLAAAIRDYVKKFRQHTNIECILALPEEELSLNADQALTIFRILQESLSNVAKHAQASRVKVLFTESQVGSLLMVVKDNGIGFDAAMHKEQTFGLLGIRERALMVGGKARINSTPGKGTRVSVSIPFLTANSQQPTANSQQPTANSQQPTAQTI